MSYLRELRRRHVFTVGAAYAVVAWVLAQVAGVVLPAFDLPTWIFRVILILLAVGFVVTVILAWVYDLTSEGIKRTADIPEETSSMARVIDFAVIGVLCVAVLALSGYIYWITRPSVEHEPVTVLIGDILNATNDPAFDGTLEPVLRIALEEAEFVSAYDRLEIRRTLGMAPADIPEVLDETSGRRLAANQGIGIVISGTLSRQGDRYELSMKVAEAVTGDEIASMQERASSRDQVVAAAMTLAGRARTVLGDDLSDTARRFAQESLSTASLDVIGAYARGSQAFMARDWQGTIDELSKAVELDPNFGLAYTGMAAAARNLGRADDADRYLQNAIAHLDGMTERERYRTRALSYGLTGDYKACATEYRDLVARYPGDTSFHSNLAMCSAYLRDWPTAIAEFRHVVEIVPQRVTYRRNLALYLPYASEFTAAEELARGLGEVGLEALAFAQYGQLRLAEARETIGQIPAADVRRSSAATALLADIESFEGRFSVAASILREGISKDMESGNSGNAARKWAQLGQIDLWRGEQNEAIAAVDEALATDQSVEIRFLAARVLAAAGQDAKARMFAETLASEFPAEPRAYAKIITGLLELRDNPREAVTHFTEANELFDTWIGHFDLGRAYLDAGGALQAQVEFDRCIDRRGEALSLFLDDVPTYSYFPEVYYYQGRAREEMNSATYAESYRRYLEIRGNSGEDPFAAAVRERAGL